MGGRHQRSGRMALRALSAALVPVMALGLGTQASTADEPEYYVISHGTDIDIVSSADATAEALAEEAGYGGDRYIYEVTDQGDYTSVRVYEAMSVTVTSDGETHTGRTAGGTVAELLDVLDITLGEEDILSCPPDTVLTDGLTVTVCRVTYGEETEEEAIPHGTEYQEDPELEKGQEKTVTEGTDGLKRLTYRVRYEDGSETDRELTGEETVTEPTPTVIARGTKEKPKEETQEKPKEKPKSNDTKPKDTKPADTKPADTKPADEKPADTKPAEPEPEKEPEPAPEKPAEPDAGEKTITTPSGETLSYSKVLTMKATAYSYDAGAWTASGAPVQVGIVAALPSTIPQGTRVYIVTKDGKYTYGPAIVGDTPGGDIIDLFFETEAECERFGVRQADVYILS